MLEMKKLLYSLGFLAFTACSPQPQAIDYGADYCDNCRMTIVDQKHAAELVTTKGRAYKFDAIECMVDYLQQREKADFALFLVNDFTQASELVDAKECQFLFSPNIPSPMGGFLSAFHSEEEAKRWQAEKDGKLYDWDELQAYLSQ